MSIVVDPIDAKKSPRRAVTAQLPVAVYTCTRLGRVANPPSFSLTDWLRPGRRR